MKIICIGRNYSEHIDELANQRPESPVVFIKPDSSILPKNQPFFIPPFSNDIHYEAEIVVKINKVGKYITKRFSTTYFSEFSLGIDFTARDVQTQLKQKGLPWELAKGFDGSCFLSDQWLSTSNYNLQNIDFSLHKNDRTVQKGNTAEMLFKVDEIIAYVSQFFTLKIGDLIFTGTPAGVGPVSQNDILTGMIEDKEMFTLKIK